jgi:hypothetical protein
MPLLTGRELAGSVRRTYHVEVPASPLRSTLPVIVVFHGGGQDAKTIAARWGVDPPDPVLNSDLGGSFRGFAAVGKALDPEKSRHYRAQLAASGTVPAPVVYVHGTADRGFRPTFTLEETPLEETLPFFTAREMFLRNEIPGQRRGLDRTRSRQHRSHRGGDAAVRGTGGVPPSHGRQRGAQLADADHGRQSAGRRTLRRNQHHRRVLALARRSSMSGRLGFVLPARCGFQVCSSSESTGRW